METVLQILGSAAIVQFATKKLLFAKVSPSTCFFLKKEKKKNLQKFRGHYINIFPFQCQDRKVTLGQVDEFLNTKIAPKELADEIKVHLYL